MEKDRAESHRLRSVWRCESYHISRGLQSTGDSKKICHMWFSLYIFVLPLSHPIPCLQALLCLKHSNLFSDFTLTLGYKQLEWWVLPILTHLHAHWHLHGSSPFLGINKGYKVPFLWHWGLPCFPKLPQITNSFIMQNTGPKVQYLDFTINRP
jgi:hypothetical protein